MNLHIFQQRSLKARVTLFTLSIFIISIWTLSYYASLVLKDDMGRLLGEQQFSTVSYVAEKIDQELADRLDILARVAGKITPAVLNDSVSLQALLDDRLILKGPFNAGVAVYRPNGVAVAQVPHSAGWIGVDYMDAESLSATLKNGKPIVGRPIADKRLRTTLIGMTAPILDANGKVIGVIAGVTNLNLPNFLDKITQNTYGKTGGYLLVSREHRLVITATDKSRALEPVPAVGTNPLIDRFMQGYEGSGTMINPQGAEVLVSVKGAPTANWLVSSILPAKEAFAPIDTVQQQMLIVTILLTVLAAVLTWWMLKRQLSQMLDTAKALAAMSTADRPFQPLPVVRQDEMGQLISGFNRLLEILSQREGQLKTLNEELSTRVEQEVLRRMQAEDAHQKERTALIQSEKMAQLGNMLGAIIHQWKQPLNSIAVEAQGIVDSYKYNELNEAEINRAVSSIMSKIAFMAATADDFRDFYKPSKEKKAFSLVEQIESVVKLLGKQLKTSNIEVSIEGDSAIGVIGFTSEFKQVILNIIINAKDAFEEKQIKDPRLNIKVVQDGEKVLITLCDNAGGIPTELLPDKLFEPFLSTKGEKGTGIGLSLSRSIIEENMGGKLSAENKDDGACFTVNLPIA